MNDEARVHAGVGLRGEPFFASWSGGKDSCLALHRAVEGGGRLALLLTMLDASGRRSHSHALPPELVEAQAERLGAPVVFRAASWGDYEARFLDALAEIRGRGVRHGVFGDIDLEPHRAWVRRVCGAAGVVPHLPLWGWERRRVLEAFLSLGYRARIVSLREAALDASFLGRALDAEVVADLLAAGIDPAGEQGEYHTVVTGGPLFSSPLRLRETGRASRDGYGFSLLAADPEAPDPGRAGP